MDCVPRERLLSRPPKFWYLTHPFVISMQRGEVSHRSPADGPVPDCDASRRMLNVARRGITVRRQNVACLLSLQLSPQQNFQTVSHRHHHRQKEEKNKLSRLVSFKIFSLTCKRGRLLGNNGCAQRCPPYYF